MATLITDLMTIGGLGAMAYALWLVLLGRQAANWPTVTGEVLSTASGTELAGGLPGTGRAKVQTATIKYRYRVRGRSFTGTRVCVGGELFTTSPDRAQRLLSRYPAGTEVTVHHHPKRPRTACLEPRVEVAGFTAAMGLALVVASWLLG